MTPVARYSVPLLAGIAAYFGGVHLPSAPIEAPASPLAAVGWIDIVALGADPTGAADAVPFVLQAFTLLPNGGVVYLRGGSTFVFEQRVVVPNNIQFRGDGIGNTVILHGMQNIGAVFRIPSTSHNVLFSDFTLNGQLSKGMLADFAQFEVGDSLTQRCENCQLIRVEILDFDHMAIADAGKHTRVTDCRIRGTFTPGVEVQSSIWGIWQAWTAHGLQVTGCDFRNLWGSAILGYGDDVRISHNTVESTHMANYPGPWFSGGQIAMGETPGDMSFSWVITENHILTGGGAGTSGIEIHGVDVVISDNIIYQQQQAGIALQGGGLTRRTVADNIIKGCGTAIFAQGGLQDFTLNGNDCHQNQLGIQIAAGCSDYVLVGNRSLNNTTNYTNLSVAGGVIGTNRW